MELERDLRGIRETLTELGCDHAYVKVLGANNNSKQQIYLGADLRDLNWLPKGPLVQSAGTSKKASAGGPIVSCAVDFWWLTDEGPRSAPHAQLIAYPQYPEVRLSGLLRGANGAPSDLLDINRRGKEPGRVLVLAPWRHKSVIGLLVGPETELARFLTGLVENEEGLLGFWSLEEGATERTLDTVLRELGDLSRAGWIGGQRMRPDGLIVPYNAPNAGGYTLEASLGVPSNADRGSDIPGVGELKQLAQGSGRVTLMDMPPLGGAFCELDRESFFQRFGKANCAGTQFHFTVAKRRGYRFDYDAEWRQPPGLGEAMFLLRRADEVVASWPLAHVAEHWARKHSRTILVRSESRRGDGGNREFRYSSAVQVFEGARLANLTRAVEEGKLGVDPGCWIKRKVDGSWTDGKVRFGFRIHPRHLPNLYERHLVVDTSKL